MRRSFDARGGTSPSIDDWVSINQSSDDQFNSNEAPSPDEAVSALQLVVDPTHYSQLEDNRTFSLENAEASTPTPLVSRVSSFGSESDWIEPSLHLSCPMMLQRHGSVNVYDALHLLQTEPSIKMDFQENYFKNQLKNIHAARDAKEDSFEKLQHEERQKVKESNAGRNDGVVDFIRYQDKEMEEFGSERDELMKILKEERAAVQQRYYDEVVELENKFDAKLN